MEDNNLYRNDILNSQRFSQATDTAGSEIELVNNLHENSPNFYATKSMKD